MHSRKRSTAWCVRSMHAIQRISNTGSRRGRRVSPSTVRHFEGCCVLVLKRPPSSVYNSWLGTIRLADDAAVVEFQHAIGDWEVPVIMRDHDHGLSCATQLRQQLLVEHGLERGVLIGGPFVEEIE